MQKVLVTGSAGFIGRNLCAQLEQDKDIEVLRHNHKTDMQGLTSQLEQADFIFHLAGVNRPTDEKDFETGNHELTKTILGILKQLQRTTPVLLTSSIQADLDNPYGKSKKAAEDSLRTWGEETGAKTYIYRLPNVYGKWCKPNYNSVVATFCHNIANGLEITINNPESVLDLAYIDNVVADFVSALHASKSVNKDGFCEIEQLSTLNLGELAKKLYALYEIRKTLTVPDLHDPLDRNLYATLTSYFDKDGFDYALDMKQDERGWLAEFIKSPHAGQVFVSRTNPGFVRGNHWHQTKIEKFLVIAGEGEVAFRDLGSDTSFSYKVSGQELRVVDIPVGYIHNLKNIGTNDLITIIWADEVFDPEKPDTYYQEV